MCIVLCIYWINDISVFVIVFYLIYFCIFVNVIVLFLKLKEKNIIEMNNEI